MFYLFFLNSSTMGLSTTLFVMALLLSGKNLWFYKVLESFHCVKSDSCKPRPETWWVLFTFYPVLHNTTGKKKRLWWRRRKHHD